MKWDFASFSLGAGAGSVYIVLCYLIGRLTSRRRP